MILIRSDLWKSGALLAAILPKNKCDMISVLPQQVKAGAWRKRPRNWMKFTISDGKGPYRHAPSRASSTWSEKRTIPVSPETGQKRRLLRNDGNGSGIAGWLLRENICGFARPSLFTLKGLPHSTHRTPCVWPAQGPNQVFLNQSACHAWAFHGYTARAAAGTPGAIFPALRPTDPPDPPCRCAPWQRRVSAHPV